MLSSLGILKNTSPPGVPCSTGIPSSPLREALRRSPFSREIKDRNQGRLASQEEKKEVQTLNVDLQLLSQLFPNIQFDVLREVLVKFDGESRLHICVGQLLSHRAAWVKGRWQNPPRDIDDDVPLEETFRTSKYKSETRHFLSQEFPYLSKSTVDGVLAESNFCYTRCRPILDKLSSRTWRATISSLNIFRRQKSGSTSPTQLLEKNSKSNDASGSASDELDLEIQRHFIRPALLQQEQRQLSQDQELAEELNETEAREAAALHECECCCTETTFERILSCTTNGHMICLDCARRTVHEAIFGQGWGRAVDLDRGALKCLAPLAQGSCDGYIPHSVIRRIMLGEKSGVETWARFEDRLAVDSLLRSSLKLIRCPFCSYAEADPSQHLDGSSSQTCRIRKAHSITKILFIMISLHLLPIFLLLIGLVLVVYLTTSSNIIRTSLHNLSLRQRSPRFRCRHPACLRTSCLKCHKAWHDPHICHEPLLLSLRTTVEAARTAAIKRTCPRCGLSFVKSSGCNKLTCVCGYSMCYLCRTAISAPSIAHQDPRRHRDDHMEGYRHFCEHFRINPGRPCTECRKCDLYRSENEDEIVKRAGEAAEQEWRIREGMVGVEGLIETTDHQKQRWLMAVLKGGWSWQDLIDLIVGSLVEVDI